MVRVLPVPWFNKKKGEVMRWSNVPRRLLVVGAATAVILGSGVFVSKTFVSPAYAACHGIGNPGNNKLVGKAGEHPPGGGGNSITGDRGGSR